ncbi:MAG: hypothetical protein WBF48_00775 [Halarcobacter sp.]
MMKWVDEFENKFSVKKTEKNQPFLIIEGECRYLQKVGETKLALEVEDIKDVDCTVYNKFDVVAFLVKDWIKIQDSLEMLFNLISGDIKKSLRLLSYLRDKDINAHEFAVYLYNSHKIVLINRFTHPKRNKNRKSQLSNIIALIKELDTDCHVLVVGDREYISLENQKHVVELGKVLHPSGVVLNTKYEDYYKTWYQFDDNSCRYKTDGFSLSNFHRI